MIKIHVHRPKGKVEHRSVKRKGVKLRTPLTADSEQHDKVNITGITLTLLTLLKLTLLTLMLTH
jgi:hypothetical protein